MFVKSSLKVSVATNACIKAFALVISFMSTPLMMNFFSNEVVLGVWFTVLSVLNWISFFDFGIGNGLRNDLTYALSEHDKEKARVVTSSSFFLLGGVVVLLVPVGVVVSIFVNWNLAFSVDTDILGARDLSLGMAIVIVGMLLQLVFKLVNSLLYAVQKNVVPAFLLLVSNCLILLAVAFPPIMDGHNEKFIYMCLVEVMALSIPLITAAVVLFATELKYCFPSIRMVRTDCFRSLGTVGLKFFFIQLALLFVSSTNELFIGSICGADNVVSYSVAFRVFNFVLVFFGVMAQPIWSEMARAFSSGDRARLLSVHKKYLSLAMLSSVFVILIGLTVNPILRIWLGYQAPMLNLVESSSLVFLVIVTVLTNSETCLGNATNHLMPQLFFYSIGAFLKYPLAVVLSAVVSGWSSVVFSNAFVLIPVLICQHVANLWLTADSKGLAHGES